MDVKSVARRANELVGQIGTLRRKRILRENRLNKRIEALKKNEGPAIEILKQQEEGLVSELIDLITPNFRQLAIKGTATIKLRTGTISLRRSPEALEISDEKAVMRGLRRLGKILSYTVLPERRLNKNAIKKDPELVAKLNGASLVRDTKVIIRPSSASGEEIIRSSDTLSIPVSDIEEN